MTIKTKRTVKQNYINNLKNLESKMIQLSNLIKSNSTNGLKVSYLKSLKNCYEQKTVLETRIFNLEMEITSLELSYIK